LISFGFCHRCAHYRHFGYLIAITSLLSFVLFNARCHYRIGSWNLSNLFSSRKYSNSVKAQTEYTLVNITDDFARVKINGSLTSDQPDKENILLPNGSATLKGNQEGYFLININDGIITHSEIKGHVKGELTVMNQNVPITITTERWLETRIK
jgi:uncharacterized protein DUF6263